METIKDYLVKTESATRKLFEGINSYLEMLRSGMMGSILQQIIPINPDKLEQEKYEAEYQNWLDSTVIKQCIEIQNKFVDELFAMDVLSGSLLQIAAMGIQKYSTNEMVPEAFSSIIRSGTKPARFCIGRCERDIPIGLIIYAGRNQYNHFDDNELGEPSKSIFERLCLIESFKNKGTFYRNPNFDLRNEDLICYSGNITALLGWRTYEPFFQDMIDMLG